MTPREDTENAEDEPEQAAPKRSEAGEKKPGRSRKRRTRARSSESTDADDDDALEFDDERERAHVLAALEAGIAEALPGVEILDRELSFDEGGVADLVAVDPIGRLVLVLVAGANTDRAALAALDLMAYACANAALIVRHLGSRRVDPSLEPRAVVIDPSNDPRLRDRLAALGASGFEVFGVKTLASAAGERAYLVAAPPPRRAAGTPGGTAGVQAFLDALPLPLQEVGRDAADRMARLDEDLLPSADGRALVWRWHGEVLARLENTGDRLTASVAPYHDPSPIRNLDDVDDLLEGTLARLVQEFEFGGRVEPEAEERHPRDIPRDAPILTDEERAAFFD